MAQIEFAPDAAQDIDRIVEHPIQREVIDKTARIESIIEAIDALASNPLIGRAPPDVKRELVIGRRSRGGRLKFRVRHFPTSSYLCLPVKHGGQYACHWRGSACVGVYKHIHHRTMRVTESANFSVRSCFSTPSLVEIVACPALYASHSPTRCINVMARGDAREAIFCDDEDR